MRPGFGIGPRQRRPAGHHIPQDNATKQKLVSRVLHKVFDGAIDQLVQSVLSLRQPTPEELEKLETLLQEARSNKKTKRERGRS